MHTDPRGTRNSSSQLIKQCLVLLPRYAPNCVAETLSVNVSPGTYPVCGSRYWGTILELNLPKTLQPFRAEERSLLSYLAHGAMFFKEIMWQ